MPESYASPQNDYGHELEGAGTSAVTCLFRGRFRKPLPVRNGAGALKLDVAVRTYMGGECGLYKAANYLVLTVMFGLELPKLIATRRAGWQWTGDVHGLLANYLMLALVGLHVVAALYHYLNRRDGVLQRMLPRGLGGV